MSKKLTPVFILMAFAALVLGACSPVVQAEGPELPEPTAQAEATPVPGPGDPRPAQIDDLHVEVGVGSPIPVTAVIGGFLPGTCDQVAQVLQEQSGSEFRLWILTTHSTDPDCRQEPQPFTARVPLNVVSLAAGEYMVTANEARATFNLDTGNTNAVSVEPGVPPVVTEAQIDDVNILIGTGSPIPVYVVISGSLPDTCAQLGELQLRRVGTAGVGFHLGVMAHTRPADGCVQDSLPFRLEFPLNVAGLPAGPYNVSVNGVTASFDPRAMPAPDGPAPVHVEHVQVEIGVGSPIPVEVLVSGSWPGLCAQLSEIRQEVNGSHIGISLMTASLDPNCPPDYVGVPFRIALPLNGVELPEGAYTVEVNGVTTSFTWPASAGQ